MKFRINEILHQDPHPVLKSDWFQLNKTVVNKQTGKQEMNVSVHRVE